MQSSFWKLITAVGIIGIGTLVVLEVQNRLPVAATAQNSDSSPSAAPETPFSESGVEPDATTEFDLLFSDLNEPSTAATADPADRLASNAADSEVRRASLLDGDNPFAAFENGASLAGAPDASVSQASYGSSPQSATAAAPSATGATPTSGEDAEATAQPFADDGRDASQALPTFSLSEPDDQQSAATESSPLSDSGTPSGTMPSTSRAMDSGSDLFPEDAATGRETPDPVADASGSAAAAPAFDSGFADFFQESQDSANSAAAASPAGEHSAASQSGSAAEDEDKAAFDVPFFTDDTNDSTGSPSPSSASSSSTSGPLAAPPASNAADDAETSGLPDLPFFNDDTVPAEPFRETDRDSGSNTGSGARAEPPLFPDPSRAAPRESSSSAGSAAPRTTRPTADDPGFFTEDDSVDAPRTGSPGVRPGEFDDGALPPLPRSPGRSPADGLANEQNTDPPPFEFDPEIRLPLDDVPDAPARDTTGHPTRPDSGRRDPSPLRDPRSLATGRPAEPMNDLRTRGGDDAFGEDLMPIPTVPSGRPGMIDTGDQPLTDAGPESDSVRTASATLSEVMRPHLTIRKSAPPTATVGVPLEYTIEVTNDGQSDATDVVVEDILPATVDLDTARPVPVYDRESRLMQWRFTELRAGETQTMAIRVVPTGEGTLDGVATVRFKAQVRSSTRITSPRLALTMTGPSDVRLGDEISFRFVIRNEGSGDARDVILRNVLPAGLQHPEGNDLEYEISLLPRGEEREVTLSVVAAEPGEYSSLAEVTSSGIAADSASLPITIVGAQLSLERLGPQRRYVGRAARYQNVVSNDTPFAAANAVVIERVPEGMRFVSASHNGEYNPAERLITWRIPQIPSGKQALLDVELTAERPGDMDSVVELIEEAGFRTRATKTIAIEDLHNVSADTSRLEGPVAVGEKFGFAIVVDNRGTAVATNVQLAVEVPAQITVLAAGTTELKATRTAGNVVRYASVLEIRPDEQQVFQLTLQGAAPVQNALIKAQVRYDGMPQPLVVSESVTVYSDSL